LFKEFAINIYQFQCPIDFLVQYIEKSFGRGFRSKLATHLGCQTSFISQVLGKRVHLSLEQAVLISEFIKLPQEESHFFLLLVQRDKAGSTKLKNFFNDQIEGLLKKRRLVTHRIGSPEEISDLDQKTYYQYWWHVAIHILCGLDSINTREDIARYFNLPLEIVDHTLTFLISKGFVNEVNGGLEVGKTRIHLGSESPNVTRHHINWRNRVIPNLEKFKSTDLHYSAVIGIAQKDFALINEKILKMLEDVEKVIQNSDAIEAPYSLLIDSFALERI
jgi:uncharacterized protein (TIGR02147 family)